VDLWEPAEREDPQAERMVAYNLREMRAGQAGQDTGHEKSQKALQPLAALMRRLIQPLVSSSRTARQYRPYSRRQESSPTFEIVVPWNFAYILAAMRTTLPLVGYDLSLEDETDWNGVGLLLLTDLRAESASREQPHQFLQSEHF